MVSKIQLIEAGYCHQLERFADSKNGRYKNIKFPATVSVIEHPREGVILFDTGYSEAFHHATRYFPEKFYALITPVTISPEETAKAKLAKMGILEKDVRTVVLSHFHADHIAGVRDFKHARYVYHFQESDGFFNRSRFSQISHGFLAKLLPDDFRNRSLLLNSFTSPIPELGEGWFGHDLFNDESLFIVPLLGHTAGHVGLFVRVENGERYFLVGDASYLMSSIKSNSEPARIAELIFDDRSKYKQTLGRLHSLNQTLVNQNSTVKIIPCHCQTTLTNLGLA